MVLIINPVAGTGRSNDLSGMAMNFFEPDFDLDIRHTQFPGHAREIALECQQQGYGLIVVAGGDGTINEAAGAIINTDTVLGILPTGSGNGLARHLSIPMNIPKACTLIRQGRTFTIDAGMANDHLFFCTAGVGFDAYIGHEFARGKSRGLYGYVNHVIREYFRYRSRSYEVGTGENLEDREAFIITVANAGQYGNNAYIAPHANIADGYLDLCVVRNFPKLRAIKMGIQLFNKTISRSPYYSTEKIQSIRIGMKGEGFYHLDGEVFPLNSRLDISVVPRCLKVIVP